MAKTASGGQGPYDEPGNAESAPANLKSLEETGSKPKKQAIGQKSLAETEESANSLYKSSGAASEPGVHDATVGGGYNKHSNPSGTRAWLFNNRRKLIAGGSVTAILATLAITLFLFVLPLKIMHIVNNLQDRFFATSQSAVDKQVSSLEAHYLKTYVFKGLGGSTCRAGQTIDKNCHPLEVTGNSYVTKLYKTWRANRLEYKMAQDYGLEFKKVGNNIFMKVAGMGGNGVALDETFLNSNESIDDFIQRSNDPEWKKVNHNEARQAIIAATDGEVLYKRVWYRFKIGRFAEEKWGIRRCIVFCKQTDNFDDWKGRKKDAAKAYMIDRVITPRSMGLSIVLRCVLGGLNEDTGETGGSVCKVEPDPPSTTCADGDCELNGAPETSWEKELRADIAFYRSSSEGKKTVRELLDEVDKIGSKGYTTYIAEKMLYTAQGFNSRSKDRQKRIGPTLPPDNGTAEAKAARDAAQKEFNQLLSDKLTKGGNIVGALDTLASIFDYLPKVGPELHKMTYVTNSATMVQTFAMYRTYADEMKTGNVDAAIVGSFTKTFDGSPNKVGHQPFLRIVGGNASAEETPLYGVLMSGETPKKNSSALNNISPTALAATTNNTPSYQCNNQEPVATPDKLVCNEENLAYNKTADQFNGIADNESLSVLIEVSHQWVKIRNKLFGKIIKAVTWAVTQLVSFITSVLGIIPGSDDIARAINKWYRNLMEWLVLYLIPSPIGENTSGGRMFDVVAGGADVAGNEYAHHGLGGKAISPKEAAQISSDQQQLALAQYKSQPFIKRVMDTDSQYSAASKLALAMPDNRSDIVGNLFNSFGNNFLARIFQNFGNLFSLNKAHAAGGVVLDPDPFSVTQYGYTDKDIKDIGDPEVYWNLHCHDPTQPEASPQINLAQNSKTYNWNANVRLNSDTYMPENDHTNPCLLIQAAVGSAGALYDSSLLTQDDQYEGGTDTNPATSADANIDTNDLYKSSVGVACALGTRDIGVYDGYTNGQAVKIRLCAVPGFPSTGEESNGGYGVSGANGQAVVNSRVSGAVLAMIKAAKAAGLSLSARSTFRTMSHQQALFAYDPDPTRVARPGYSNHQMGLAIDFQGLSSSPGPAPGNSVWDWLSKNADNFGYKNYPAEAWHWSPTGN